MWQHIRCFIAGGMAVLVVGAAIAQAAPSPDELSRLRDMWLTGRYRDVLPLLIAYRDQHTGTPELDYMIATSACQMNNQKIANEQFRWILARYSLTSADRRTVEGEMQVCVPGGVPPPLINSGLRASAGVSGKGFAWIVAGTTPVITSDPITVIRVIDPAELSSRLFPISDQERAARRIRELVGSRFLVEARGRFVLASASRLTSADLADLAQLLEKALGFFVSQYGMLLPSHLITVYIVPDPNALESLAERIHGLKVSFATLGYSYREDSSIVGVIPQPAYGTLIHELFHLAVRGNFGDIPPWLDEGMASLYEVSQFTGNRLIGQDNWRGPLLEKFWKMRPTIEALVKMDWWHFDGLDLREGSEKSITQVVNHATARYVALYLQDKGSLTMLYRAMRSRTPRSIQGDPGADAVGVVESTLQRPVTRIDDDFGRWFCDQLHHNCVR